MIRKEWKKKQWYQENWNEQILPILFQSVKKNLNNEFFIWLNIQPSKNDFLPCMW